MINIEFYCRNRRRTYTPISRAQCLMSTLILLLASMTANPLLAVEIEANQYERLDWIPQGQLSPAEQEILPTGCCGAYVNPTNAHTNDIPLEQAPIEVKAGSGSISREGIITLKNKVELSQGARQVKAEEIITDRAAGIMQLNNNIVVRENGLLMHAQNASMNINNADAELNDVEFILHQSRIHGTALHLTKSGNNLLRLINGAITTCPPDSNFWSLEAGEITIHSNKHYGTAHNARLKIKGVPIIYVPYIRFPVGDERQSGLLYPSMGESTQNGFEYAQPFYWSIAPQADLTLTPRYMSKRGWLLDATARHKSTLFNTELSGGYLYNDKGGFNREAENNINNGLLTPDEAYPFKNETRWMLQLKQTGQLSQRIKTNIDYTDLSDNLYLLDINNSDLDTNRTALTQKAASIHYTGEQWAASAHLQEFRALNETRQKPYREMPRVHINGRYSIENWQLNLNHEYTHFDLTPYYKKTTNALVTGDRFRTDYGISWDKQWTAGFLKPYIGVKTLSYQLQQATQDMSNITDQTNGRSPSLIAPQAYLDMGLTFERTGSIGSHAYIQTLEPRMFYFYSQFEDHNDLYHPLNNTNNAINFDTSYLTFSYNQLFRTTRFAGGDRIDDANQIATGITSRFISPATGIEHLRLSLGQVYRFDKSQVGLYANQPTTQVPSGASEYAFQVSALIGKNTRLSGDMLYSQHTHNLSNGSASLQYIGDNYQLINLSYRYSEATLDELGNESYGKRDQIDASVFLPLTTSWSLIARSHYDFTYKRELDTFAGFEYNDCCYKIRFVWRRFLNFDYNTAQSLGAISNNDYEQGIFFDLQLKGLGDISKRVGTLLSQTIAGYSTREKNVR